MLEYLKTYWNLTHDKRAVTALEYALIAGLVSVVIITIVTTLGTNLTNVFTKISGDVAGA